MGDNIRPRTLPADSVARKEIPLYRGLIKYFPAALAGVAKHSKIGNDKHNPGQEFHHARGKSSDHPDCVIRHSVDIGDIEYALSGMDFDTEAYGESVEELLREANALSWRALAWSQELHERFGGAPIAPGTRE